MTVVGHKALWDFIHKHKEIEGAAKSWLAEAENAQWRSPHDIRERYSNVSILGGFRVIFNLGRKKNYRIEVKVDYKRQIVVIKRCGTHAEYLKWK